MEDKLKFILNLIGLRIKVVMVRVLLVMGE